MRKIFTAVLLVMVLCSCSNVAPTEPVTLYDENLYISASVNIRNSFMTVRVIVNDGDANRIEGLTCFFDGNTIDEIDPGVYECSVIGEFYEGQEFLFSVYYENEYIDFKSRVTKKPVMLSPLDGLTVEKGTYIQARWNNKPDDVRQIKYFFTREQNNTFVYSGNSYVGSESIATEYINTKYHSTGDYYLSVANMLESNIKRNDKICGAVNTSIWSDFVRISIIE